LKRKMHKGQYGEDVLDDGDIRNGPTSDGSYTSHRNMLGSVAPDIN